MVENKEILAKNLARLMEQKKVNAAEICQKLDIKHNTFSSWINAKTYPRIDKIEMLANYFGVSKAALVEDVTRVVDLTPSELDFLIAYRQADFVTRSAIDRLITYYNNLEDLKKNSKDSKNSENSKNSKNDKK
jgi:transcriptional regulator with XRE-family HTH domain